MSDGIGGGAPAGGGQSQGGDVNQNPNPNPNENPEVKDDASQLKGRVTPDPKDKKEDDGKGEKKEPPKKRRYLDIDGQRVDEDEIRTAYQKRKDADEQYRKSAAAQKQVEQFMERLQKDPESILTDPRLNLNLDDLAEKILKKKLQKMTADPKDLEIEELKAKTAKYEESEKAIKDRQAKEENDRLIASRRDTIAKVLNEAMAGTPLSQDPELAAETLREMALYFRQAKAKGENPDPKAIAEHVSNQRLKSFRTATKAMDGEALINYFGEEMVAKIRKADLERIRKGRKRPEVGNTIPKDQWQSRNEKKDDKPKFLDPYDARFNK